MPFYLFFIFACICTNIHGMNYKDAFANKDFLSYLEKNTSYVRDQTDLWNAANRQYQKIMREIQKDPMSSDRDYLDRQASSIWEYYSKIDLPALQGKYFFFYKKYEKEVAFNKNVEKVRKMAPIDINKLFEGHDCMANEH